jgi:hypothetical protein
VDDVETAYETPPPTKLKLKTQKTTSAKRTIFYCSGQQSHSPSRSHRKLATAGSFWPEASMENVTNAFQPSSLFLASNSE